MSRRSPAVAGAVLSLLFGTGLIGAVAPFQAPDEIEHFLRAQLVLEGVLMPERRIPPGADPDANVNTTGGELPQSLAAVDLFFAPLRLRPDRAIATDTLRSAFDLRLAPDRRAFLPFANTALASPLPYLPQAAGIALARRWTDSVLAQAYAGRAGNLLAYTAMMVAAIAATPFASWAFVALAVAPTPLAQAASLSSDATTNGLAFLWIAVVLRCASARRGRLGPGAFAGLAALSIAIGLVKQMYLPLPLLAFWIPAERFGGRARRIAGVAALLVLAAAATLAWNLPARAIFSPIEPGIDPDAQLAHVLGDPIHFAFTIVRTIATFGGSLFWQYWGVLGTLDTEIPHPLLAGWALAVALAAGFAAGSPTRAQRLLAVAIAAATFGMVCLSIHLVAGVVGADVVWLQGRYLVPIGPLLAIAVAGLLQPARGLAAPLATAAPIALVLFLAGGQIVTVRAAHTRFFRAAGAAPDPFEWSARDRAFRTAGQAEGVVTTFAAALGRTAPDVVALYARAYAAEGAAAPDGAVEEYRAVLRAEPEAPLVARHLAALLLARAQPSDADLAEAERLARRACQSSRFEDPHEIAMLADALHARGRSREAVRLRRAALERARAAGEEPLARRLERQIEAP